MSTQMISTESIRNTIQNAFPFEVEKYPLSGPDNMPSPHFGLFRDDTMASVGRAVTKTYNPHTVEDICVLAEAASEAFEGAGNISAHWNDGHYITVSPDRGAARKVFDKRYPDAGAHEIFETSDVYMPRLIIRAGYDGTAFSAELGIYRLVCRNLAVIPVMGRTVGAKIRHTAHLQNRIEDLVADFRRVISGFDAISNQIDRANQREVKMADFIREVYPLRDDATDRVVRSHEKRVEAIMARLYRERNALGLPSEDYRKATAWEAYNAVQGYVQHDARRNKNPQAFDRAILAMKDSGVARAAEIAFA